MQYKSLTIGEAWQAFKQQGLASQVYIVCFVLIFASGQTFLHGFVPQIMAVMLAAEIFAVLERRRGHRSRHIQLAGSLSVGTTILLLISLFCLLQMSFAFAPSIAKTYSIRYAIFAALTLFIVDSRVLSVCVRLVSSYLNVCAVTVIVSTVLLGSKTGGLLGNYQAAGMMMSIASVLNLIDYYRGGRKSTYLWLTLLTVLALLFTGKRTFALIVLGAVFVIYLFASKGKKSVLKVLLVVAVVAFVGIAAYSFTDIGKSAFERFALLASDDDFEAMSGRNLLWDAAWVTFIEHPQMGIGFGSFEQWYAAYYAMNRGAAYLTHNIYYGMLAETGFVGTALFVFLFIWGIVSTFRTLTKARRGSSNVDLDYILVVSVALQLWFIVYGFTGNGIYDANEMFFYIVALVMSISARKQLASEAEPEPRRKRRNGSYEKG